MDLDIEIYPADEDEEEESYTPSMTYGVPREEFLKENKPEYYKRLVESGTLLEHLKSIDKFAFELEENMIERQCEIEGVNEELKKRDMFEWVGKYNLIKHEVRGFILRDFIFN